jgi:hypothetical protein
LSVFQREFLHEEISGPKSRAEGMIRKGHDIGNSNGHGLRPPAEAATVALRQMRSGAKQNFETV